MTAAFHTLGCKTNAYETQAVIEQFREAGFEIGDFSDACDVYVINTCAVTREAARKSRQMINRCRRMNPKALVAVTGCYAQEKPESILDECSADLVVGNGEKSRLLPAVQELLQNRDAACRLQVTDPSHQREYERQQISGQEGHVRAYVKIQDGCDRFCSYCLIPFLRGRSRSRKKEDILQEVRLLAEKDYHEIILTGIDISSYTLDENLQRSPEQSGKDLAGIMEEVSQIPGIRRIRLGSLEAGIVSETLIQNLRGIPSFCPQFHLSLQSGSDTVLKRMNRHYTLQEYASCVEMIRRYFPKAGITTDIITGFPGETEEEFQETLEYTRKTEFSRIHVFPYSRRPGTRADHMPDQLTRQIKDQRARVLIREGEALRRNYEETFIGTSCEILVEEVITEDGRNYLAGYTPEYVRILVPWEGEDIPVNRFLQVAPVQFAEGTLYAR